MSKAVQKIEPKASAIVPVDPVLSMLERISTDPSVSIERVEQAFAFYQKVEADRARKEFAAAFAEMQPELPSVERKGTGHNSKKYARWEDIAEVVKPVLAKHGFGIRFNISDGENKIKVTCILSHRNGHSEETSHSFPYDPSGNKNAIQAIGSAKTYGQRYTATAILGIATRDEDDDGKTAVKAAAPASEDQRKEMERLITEAKADRGWLCSHYSVETLDDLTGSQVSDCIAKLRQRIKHSGKAEQ